MYGSTLRLNTLSCGQPLRTCTVIVSCVEFNIVSIPSHAGNLFGHICEGRVKRKTRCLNTLSCGQPLRTFLTRSTCVRTLLSLNTLSCGQPLRTYQGGASVNGDWWVSIPSHAGNLFGPIGGLDGCSTLCVSIPSHAGNLFGLDHNQNKLQWEFASQYPLMRATSSDK